MSNNATASGDSGLPFGLILAVPQYEWQPGLGELVAEPVLIPVRAMGGHRAVHEPAARACTARSGGPLLHRITLALGGVGRVRERELHADGATVFPA